LSFGGLTRQGAVTDVFAELTGPPQPLAGLYMRELFRLGYELGISGRAWETAIDGGQGHTDTASETATKP
jgi:hypothetical protein